MKAHGQIRRGQVITTYGPGALIDLPRHSAVVGGLDTWPRTSDLEEVIEPRLTRKLQLMTEVAAPRLYAPPPDPTPARPRGELAPGGSRNGSLSRKPAPAKSVRDLAAWFIAGRSTTEDASMVALSSLLGSCVPAQRDTLTISTGSASCTELQMPAGDKSGSTSAAPAAI